MKYLKGLVSSPKLATSSQHAVFFAAGLYSRGPEHFPAEGDGYMIFVSARDPACGNQKGRLDEIRLGMSLGSYLCSLCPEQISVSQVVSGQNQPNTGLAESHQVKLISSKEMCVQGSPLLFWSLNVRQEGNEALKEEFNVPCAHAILQSCSLAIVFS